MVSSVRRRARGGVVTKVLLALVVAIVVYSCVQSEAEQRQAAERQALAAAVVARQAEQERARKAAIEAAKTPEQRAAEAAAEEKRQAALKAHQVEVAKIVAQFQKMKPSDFCARELSKIKNRKGTNQAWDDAVIQVALGMGVRAPHLDSIRQKSAAIGMNSCAALAAWGRPDRINTTTRASGTRQQWVYDGGGYLYFQDDVLDAIQN